MFTTCAVVLLVSVSWTTTGLAREANPPGRFLENKINFCIVMRGYEKEGMHEYSK